MWLPGTEPSTSWAMLPRAPGPRHREAQVGSALSHFLQQKQGSFLDEKVSIDICSGSTLHTLPTWGPRTTRLPQNVMPKPPDMTHNPLNVRVQRPPAPSAATLVHKVGQDVKCSAGTCSHVLLILSCPGLSTDQCP